MMEGEVAVCVRARGHRRHNACTRELLQEVNVHGKDDRYMRLLSTETESRLSILWDTVWWVSQWVEWRKTRIAENGDPVNAAHFRSYKDWVRVIGARAAAGMGVGTVPQTPE